jgi:hypothetical protein
MTHYGKEYKWLARTQATWVEFLVPLIHTSGYSWWSDTMRPCLPFFFLHLDGLKTPIYTQTIVKWVARIYGGIQKKVKKPQPKPPLYPSPQTHPPKNLKIWSLILSLFLPRKPCVVVSTSTIISNFRSHASSIRSRDSLLLLLPCYCIWFSGPEFQDLDKRTLGFKTLTTESSSSYVHLLFYPSLFSASTVTFLFPVTFLCVHRHFSFSRHFSLRPSSLFFSHHFSLRPVDGRMNGQTDRRTDGQTDEWTNGHREGLQNRPRRLPVQNVVSDRQTHTLRELCIRYG